MNSTLNWSVLGELGNAVSRKLAASAISGELFCLIIAFKGFECREEQAAYLAGLGALTSLNFGAEA
jgi:hypothetical protein